MIIGYIRVSGADQNEARQIPPLLQEHNAEKIYIDKVSGKNTIDRPEFNKMMSFAREGDTIIAESISRMARNTKEFLEMIDIFQKNNIEFISLKESIDTKTPQGKFMLTVFAAMAELEREQILQRQAEGIAIAKAEGKYKGRAKIEVKESEFKNVVKKWRAGEYTATKAMQSLGLKPNTFYRRVKEYGL